jgi:predicted AlkP superfamily phosphohydrolase/phosphomutase
MSSEKPPSSPVFVIGLDGATLDLIEPWVREGHLPNIARLIAKGTHGRPISTLPPATFPAWSTFMTGKNPGKHGMFDFTSRVFGTYGVRFVNARDRKSDTVWRIVSEEGKKVCVLGVPATYPPEKVNGFMVSGFDAPVATGIDSSFVEPRWLYGEIRKAVGEYLVTDFQELKVDGTWHRLALPKICDVLKRKAALAKYLYKKQSWDLFVVLFGESDTVSHHFWMFWDGNSPRFSAERSGEFRSAILDVYGELDSVIGEFMEMIPPEATVMVASDHGFGGAGDKVFYLFFRKGSGGIANRIESSVRFGSIRWRSTQAFSEELNYFPSIWINVEGREPHGTVAPGAEYEKVREELIDKISQFRDPESGRPVVGRALRREEVYWGPYVTRAPDIVLELNLDTGYSYSCLPSQSPLGSEPFRKLKRDEFAGAKGRSMNGSHRRDGVLFVAGKRVIENQAIEGATLMDLAPTLLYLLGVAIPADMDGRVLEKLFPEEFLASHPPRYREMSPPRAEDDLQASHPLGGEKELRERLKGLGYLG